MTITTRQDHPPPCRLRKMGTRATSDVLTDITRAIESQVPERCEPAQHVRLTRRLRLGAHRYGDEGVRRWFQPVLEVLQRQGVVSAGCAVEYEEARSALGGFKVEIESKEQP